VCCGDFEEPAIPAAQEVLMARIFTTVPGSVQRIGNYGEASNDSPAMVPASVAGEFSGVEGFRVELDPDEKPKGHKARKEA
jgi:hypothetical protein